MPFNAFAHGEDRKTGNGMLDLCTIFHTHVSVVQEQDSQEAKEEEDEEEEARMTDVNYNLDTTLNWYVNCYCFTGTRNICLEK